MDYPIFYSIFSDAQIVVMLRLNPSASHGSMQPQSTWFLYMIRCADHSLYTGITINLDRRFAEHQAQGKKCAKYLRGKGPLALVFSTSIGTKSEASRLERQIKQWDKAAKERLVKQGRLDFRSATF